MGYVSIEQKRQKIKRNALWTLCGILFVVVIVLSVVILLKKVDAGIGNGTQGGKKPGNTLINGTSDPGNTEAPVVTPVPYDYINEEENTIATRFNAPEGYTVVSYEEGSFAEYIRNYQLKEFGKKALYYNENSGEFSNSGETSTVGVFQQRDKLTRWQQCADTAIMLYAEWLWDNEEYDKIAFEFTNGFLCEYTRWAEGDRPNSSYKGWNNGAKPEDYSRENFLKYLDIVYQYASTTSLKVQFGQVEDYESLKPGDIVVANSDELKEAANKVSPELGAQITYGHAMIVANIAVNDAGEKVFMLVEGNTPATEAAVVMNPDASQGMWFKLDENGEFVKGTGGIHWKQEWFLDFEKIN